MSLYGQIRKIGSQQFQFDRIYGSRAEMQEANSQYSDGVHIGRYVLIEYGERYETEKDENGNIIGESIIDEVTGESYTRAKFHESETFHNNFLADMEKFGVNYDSTVWQKIYFEEKEDYIMIAELNAILPRMEIEPETAVTYFPADEDHPEEEIYDAMNTRVYGVASKVNAPRFDEYQDTELVYKLRMPQALQLDVDQKSIEYNEAGFNIFYDAPKDPTPSYIHWLSQNFYGQNYQLEDGTRYSQTELDAGISKKLLRMHIPAFGNAISDLYDMLYGRAAYERDPITNEIIYAKDEQGNPIIDEFGEPVPQIAYFRNQHGFLIDDDGCTIAWDDATGWYILVRDPENTPILDSQGNKQRAHSGPVLDALRPYFKNYRDAYPYIMDITQNPPVETETLRTPVNDMDDKMYWTKDVPGIDKILSNNSAGLAAILSDLFSIANPLTGEIKYWLLNDWTAEEYNEEGNVPTLKNKPEVITYLTTTDYQNLDNLFYKHNETATNRKNWLKGVNVTGTTKIPFNIDGSEASPPISYVSPNNLYPNVENYSYYITSTKTEEVTVNGQTYRQQVPMEDGHWYIDFDAWQLRRVSTLPSALNPTPISD